MNYMNEIAKMLGVEIGEEFYVRKKGEKENLKGVYVLSEGGLKWISDDFGPCPAQLAFEDIIKGKIEIVKKPWIPEETEMYWTFYYHDNKPCYSYWGDATIDNMRLRLGFVFKTREEAECNIDKWEKFCSSTDHIDWDK